MARHSSRTSSRFLTITGRVFLSPLRRRVLGLLLLLLGLLLTVNGINVLASFVGRHFMTALAEQQTSRFFALAGLYALVFGGLTIVAVFYRFAEERLGLLWRAWLTEDLMTHYLQERAYLRLRDEGKPDNPDQRISEDVRTFTATTLSLVLIVSNSAIAVVAFSGVLWSITPWLLVAALLYAAVGTGATLLVGRRLAGLNFEQLRREADLRYGLVRIREHADEIALLSGEQDEAPRLSRRLTRAVENAKELIAVNRNLGFFTTGYGYGTQIVPVIVAAPLFLGGHVEFGAISQAAMAFGHVLGAFSLIVVEFQRLASFKAVIDRLGELWEALAPPSQPAGILVIDAPGRLAYENLTLFGPGDAGVLVRDLSLDVPVGRKLLIRGPNGAGRTALVRATAGILTRGTGRILRPQGRIMFLPQRTYLTEGTLREQLCYGVGDHRTEDADMLRVLQDVRFGRVLDRVGSLGAVRDWPRVLSQGEQQALSIARVLLARPQFVVLDEAMSTLEEDALKSAYSLLDGAGVTYVSAGNNPRLEAWHDDILELRLGGSWSVHAVR